MNDARQGMRAGAYVRDVIISPAALVSGLINDLRAIEREHPTIPRFDESTLPKRKKGESEARWMYRRADVLQAHVRKTIATLKSITPVRESIAHKVLSKLLKR